MTWPQAPSYAASFLIDTIGSQNVYFITDGCGLLIQAVTYFTFPETLELERRRPYHLTCGSPSSMLPVFIMHTFSG